MSSLTIITQAIVEAGAAGFLILALFGGVHLIPRRAKRAVRRAFYKGGL